MKINNFRGELTDISTKKEALLMTHLVGRSEITGFFKGLLNMFVSQ